MSEFLNINKEYFATANDRHFIWQTTNPCVSGREKKLLSEVGGAKAGKIIEIGCGEGGNIKLKFNANLSWYGVDFSYKKIKFAEENLRGAHFVCGDGHALPFKKDAFDTVFSRDLLHHVEEPIGILKEMSYICKAGGKMIFIEPNGKNPIIWLFATFIKAERKSKDLTSESLLNLAKKINYISDIKMEMHQPLPLHRVVYHYRFGMPNLGDGTILSTLINFIENLFTYILPKRFWAYVIITGIKKYSEV